MSSNGADDLLVQARSALLDALTALVDHRGSVVVIGAQAIYLHTGATEVALAEATKDSDLALDTRSLGSDPLIEAAMTAAKFILNPTTRQPGSWISPQGIPVDLMVPEALAGSTGRRSVRIPPHAPTAMLLASTLLLVGCTSQGTAENVTPDPSSTTSPVADPHATATGSYEADLAAVLSELGVASPGMEEHEFKGARMGGAWRDRYVVVFVTGNGDSVPAADAGTEKVISSVRVGTFTDASAGTVARFVCHDLTYTAASMRSRFAQGSSTRPAARTLAAELITVLQCP